MRVFVTGATGFVGRGPRLQRTGILFGEASVLLAASAWTSRARELRFAFDFPTLDSALEVLSEAPPSRSHPRSRDPQEPARLATSCGPGR